MTVTDLTALLVATEKAHAASGHSAKDWAAWYADFMLPKLNEAMEGEHARAWD